MTFIYSNPILIQTPVSKEVQPFIHLWLLVSLVYNVERNHCRVIRLSVWLGSFKRKKLIIYCLFLSGLILLLNIPHI